MNPPALPALAALAELASRLSVASVPGHVKAQARLCILDTVGCMLAGTRTEEAALVLRCEASSGGEPQASVLGTAQRRPLLAAIRVNGYSGDVLELNDLIGGHASIGNVCASLALAETVDSSGIALLEAVVRGIEVTSRIYNAVYPSLRRFTEMGLVPVGIPSAIGAAAAASRLLELDVERSAHAMAIAGALAGWCPAEVIFGEGGTLKPMLFGGQPGATGVTAALHARDGMTGPLRLLESKLGYFATASTAAELDLGPWSEHWALAAPRRKLHACCGYLHSALDAMGKARPSIAAAGQGAIEVHVPGYVSDVVNKTRLPVSANDARFHLQYCLALAVGGADVIEPGHSIDFRSWLELDAVTRAMGRIGVVADAGLEHYQQCRVRVRNESGDLVGDFSLTAPRGSPGAPLTERDVVDKFLRLARPVIDTAQAEAFVQDLEAIEAMPSIAPWLRRVTLPG
jgi:2-methylcitrate dehydratase PrpD